MKVRLPAVDEQWQHFKGNVYMIEGFTWDAVGDSLVLRVVYGSEGRSFSRTISNFLEPAAPGGGARFTPA